MSASTVYQEVDGLLQERLFGCVRASTRERLSLMVVGLVQSGTAGPSALAQGIAALPLGRASQAKAESVERRIRRCENDPDLCPATCLWPLVEGQWAMERPEALLLVVDGTSQDDRIYELSVSVRYRGRALPLAFDLWPANEALEGPGLWERTRTLLRQVAALIPKGVPVTVTADRAFGAVVFIEQVRALGWHYVIRLQGQTVFRDESGVETPLREMVTQRGQRFKGRGGVFKNQGFRTMSVVACWGESHAEPLFVVSDLPPSWSLLDDYRKRFSIETHFRDDKSHGWQWEKGQVRDIEHVGRLLVAMAVASWVVVCAGVQSATEMLRRRPTGQRRTVPWAGKRSLFALGLQRLRAALYGKREGLSDGQTRMWRLPDWNAPNWSDQYRAHHAKAFIFANNPVR